MMTTLDAAHLKLAPKVLLHDHLDGGLRPATVLELAAETGYDRLPAEDVEGLARWFREAADSGSLVRYLETFEHTVAVMQTVGALERVARECVEDLADDNVVYAEVRYAPEQHLEQGLTLDEVVEAVLRGFADGERIAAERGKQITVRCLVTAMRHAARSLEIAELAVRYRDRGVVGFDIAGAEAGHPPTRHLGAFEYMRANSAPFTIHARGLRTAVDPRGDRILRRRPARSRGAGHRRHRAAGGGASRRSVVHRREARPDRKRGARQADSARTVPELQRADRRGRLTRGASVQRAGATAVSRHGQHRQPAHGRHLDDQGVRPAGRALRLRVGRLRALHRERHEVGVHPLRRTAAVHRRRDQARLRGAAGLCRGARAVRLPRAWASPS